MISFKVLSNVEQIIEAIGATEKQMTIAAMRALNKTAAWLKSQSTKQISTATNLQQKLIRKRLRMIKANQTSLIALMIARLHDIRASSLGAMKQTAKGAKAGKYGFSSAFVATMPNKYRSIFKRETKRSLPIEEITLPLEPTASNIIMELANTEVMQKFDRYFEHELSFILRGGRI